MRRLVFPVIIFAFALSMANVTIGNDQLIAKQIMLKLQKQKQSGRLKGFNLDLEVESGIVTLTGSVSSKEQRFGVLDAARHVSGVRQVVNGIALRAAITETSETQASAEEPVAESTEEAAEVDAEEQTVETVETAEKTEAEAVAPQEAETPATADETKTQTDEAAQIPTTEAVTPKSVKASASTAADPSQTSVQFATSPTPRKVSPLQSASPRVSDEGIAKSITAKLTTYKESGQLRGFGINMSVDKGTVWMSGHVANQDQRDLVLDVARRVTGVKQVVNDLDVKSAEAKQQVAQSTSRNGSSRRGARQPLHNFSPPPTSEPVKETPQVNEMARTSSTPAKTVSAQKPSSTEPRVVSRPLGSGVKSEPLRRPPVALKPLTQSPGERTAAAETNVVIPRPAATAAPYYGPRVAQVPAQFAPYPVGGQVPLAFASAGGPNMAAAHHAGMAGPGMAPRSYGHLPGGSPGVVPAQYDHPQMPGYAWPSYAAHPNYAGVSYPKQYSPSAWPYIGPFHPYPQVPLGWRRVELKWKDGWWQLDFKDRYRSR